MDFPNYRIQIFAKAPIAGSVKTRMRPLLSSEQCTELHCALTTQVCNEVVGGHLCSVELWAASEPQHAFFTELRKRFGLAIHCQSGEDLGSRMAYSAEQALTKYDGVIIVGADCPFIDRDYLQQALQQLEKGIDVVIGPAMDGGYVLIGFNRFHPTIFSGIAWGTETVLEQTIERLQQLQYSFELLQAQVDIDRPQDLKFMDDQRFSEQLRKFSMLADKRIKP